MSQQTKKQAQNENKTQNKAENSGNNDNSDQQNHFNPASHPSWLNPMQWWEQYKDQASTNQHPAFEKMSEQWKNNSEKMQDTMEVISKNAEAVMHCGNIISGAGSQVAKQLASFWGNVYKDGANICSQSFSCYQPQDVVNLQEQVYNTYSKEYVNNMMDINNIMVNCANDVTKPMNDRLHETLNHVAEKYSKGNK